jgi:F0F1-type ATP synthase membrane subunit b/b'
MIGAGTFINPLIKVITTVAILAAVYFFIVKPALDTTEDITNSVNDSISQSFNGFDNLSPQFQHQIKQAEKLSDNANATSSQQIQSANKLLTCIQNANNDVTAIQRCNQKFTP